LLPVVVFMCFVMMNFTENCQHKPVLNHPLSQGLSSYRPLERTLAHAGHVSSRILEMTIKLLKGLVA